MKRRRVVYLDHTAKWSGGEIALFRTLTALDGNKWEPIALLGEQEAFGDRLKERGIQVQVDALPSGMRELKKDAIGGNIGQDKGAIKAYLRYSLRVARALRALEAELVHCNSLKADIYGLIAGKLARKPVLWHVRDHVNASYLPPRVVKIFTALARQGPAAIIANSKSTLRCLFAEQPAHPRSFVVYDGLSAAELGAPPPALRTEWTTLPVVGMVGRISRWKGQHVFIEAAKCLAAQGVSARYEVIGSPLFGEQDYYAELQDQAKGLEGRLEFKGFCHDIPAALRSMSILVHCSIIPEPFGQVIIEGMAEGLPVIASDGGGVQEILQDACHGIRTPMGDVAALTAALQSLLDNPASAAQLGAAAYAHVRKNFTAECSARGIEAVYSQVLSLA